MARNNQRGSSNNNPEGRNQHSRNWMDSAKDRPMTAAAAAAAAVGAGVFLWSRRNQISDQISNLSDQFSEWAGGQQSAGTQGASGEFEMAETGSTATTSGQAASTGRGKRGKTGGQAYAGTTGANGGTTTGTRM